MVRRQREESGWEWERNVRKGKVNGRKGKEIAEWKNVRKKR